MKGLKNLGKTSSLNCILHLFFHLPFIYTFFLSSFHNPLVLHTSFIIINRLVFSLLASLMIIMLIVSIAVSLNSYMNFMLIIMIPMWFLILFFFIFGLYFSLHSILILVNRRSAERKNSYCFRMAWFIPTNSLLSNQTRRRRVKLLPLSLLWSNHSQWTGYFYLYFDLFSTEETRHTGPFITVTRSTNFDFKTMAFF